MEIILASNSPRRKEILQNGGINFKIEQAKCNEIYSKRYNEYILKKNSQMKAFAIKNSNAVIIAADTIVILNSVCLVKPQNILEAFFMLKKLSNKTHMVATSHTVLNSKTGKYLTEISKSYVTFKRLSYWEILKYLLLKKPFDKAGSYGIQDFLTPLNYQNPPKSSFISAVTGSYYNIMGLDIDLVKCMLEKI